MKFDNRGILFLSALLTATLTDAFVLQKSSSVQLSDFGVRLSLPVQKTARLPSTKLYALDDDDNDDDEDDENPLGRGVDSVAWLPSVIGNTGGKVPNIKEGTEILPLFPLGGFVYTPNTEHVLNIFEPRYRQMYTDILMNGTKRFVVATSHPTEQGRFAETGVLFELEDLKEVSEQTADQIKYICNHKVTGRVKIHKILNPEVWQTRETYLKVEGTIEDDSGKDDEKSDLVGSQKDEDVLKKSFRRLVDIQHELEEDVRFTRDAADTLAVKDGPGSDGLWQTVRLWQSFVDQRLLAAQNELQRDFQEKLQEFLKKDRGLDDDEMPSAIGFQDLTPELQAEVQELQKRMAVELQPLVLESSLTMQKILEADGHTDRLQLVKYFVESETRRLESKKTLKGIFAVGGGLKDSLLKDSSMPAEEMISSESDKSNPSFFDEPDAFQ